MTAEVRLRAVEDRDLSVFFEHQRDPSANYMAAFTGRDPSDGDAFTAHWSKIRADPRITIRTVLFHGRVAGSIASYVDDAFGKLEVTYWIGKEYWGKGIATEALSQFLERVVVTRPICGRAAKDNLASVRVMEKCGFTIVGYGKGFANARGKEIEEVILELRPDDRGKRSGS